jgi:hypothetical protein
MIWERWPRDRGPLAIMDFQRTIGAFLFSGRMIHPDWSIVHTGSIIELISIHVPCMEALKKEYATSCVVKMVES